MAIQLYDPMTFPQLSQDGDLRRFLTGELAKISASIRSITLSDSQSQISGVENLIINGAMEIDQEHAGAALTGITSSPYLVDMVSMWQLGGPGIVTTSQQVVDAPVGLKTSLKLSVTTAKVSLASGDYVSLYLPIEGHRAKRLLFGTANAQPVSLGFWVKAHRPGQYGGSLNNGSFNRAYPFAFTISAADTWQYFSLTIPGDTTGSWTITNTLWGYLNLTMAAGSGEVAAANTWAASYLQSATGQINGVAATSDTFQITGVVMIPGSIAPSSTNAASFVRLFNEELRLCQRYWEKSYNYDVAPGTAGDSAGAYYAQLSGGGLANVVDTIANSVRFSVSKRSLPTMTAYSTQTGSSGKAYDNHNAADVTPSIYSVGRGAFVFEITANAASTVYAVGGHWAADARL